MKSSRKIIPIILILLFTGFAAFTAAYRSADGNILSYTVDTKSQDLQLYWKDDTGDILKSIQNLKTFVERKNQKLVFAMNGGMFNKNFEPQGLFIQHHHTLVPLDTNDGSGNFYMKPNGVFYITDDNIPFVCKTEDFRDSTNIKYATQSGPMLLSEGHIHPAFKADSKNLNIRNGVGILPDNKVVFAMSKKEINFYDFARYFQSLGCKNALYLDGYVSRTYLPEKHWTQTDGNFGVMIAVTAKK